MAQGSFVSYLRVSTSRGRFGLGIEAQRKGVEDYLNGGGWTLVAEFVEVESGEARGPAQARRGHGRVPAPQRHPRDREA